MPFQHRIQSAAYAAAAHLCGSVVVALLAAALVFGLWFPYPYRELSGGRELFLLVIAVDVVCGPLLTLVLYNPAKPRAELWRDLGLVVVLQLGALGYGMWTVWQARPLYLVQEIDRFKVIAAPDLDATAMASLPAALRPRLWSGPLTVAIRAPRDEQERQAVLFASVQGGRDYAERPDFYIPYTGAAALKTLQRAKPLALFLERQPGQRSAALALALAQSRGQELALWHYLPVQGRQDWIAILDPQGQIQGFLPGDGF